MAYLSVILVFFIATITFSVIWFDFTYNCSYVQSINYYNASNVHNKKSLNQNQGPDVTPSSKSFSQAGISNYSDYLNEQYTTKLWSKRFLNGVDIEALHLAFATKESEKARSLFEYQTISYGGSSYETYDIYGINLPADAPVFVYVHGGYWQKFNKSISAYCVDPLVRAGIKVIIVEYELCPTVTLNEIVEQMTKFGEFILKKWDYRTSRRIVFAGHSAGAHLILCMINKLIYRFAAPLRIDSIYLISGVYDLTDLQHTAINENNILSINGSNVDRLSPLKFDFSEWLKENIAINIYVGQYDSPTFIRQSMELFLRFANGFRADFQSVQDHDHFDIVEDLSLKSYQITKDIIGIGSCDDRYNGVSAFWKYVTLGFLFLILSFFTLGLYENWDSIETKRVIILIVISVCLFVFILVSLFV